MMDVSKELLRLETSQTERISCAGSLDGFEYGAEFDVPRTAGDVPGGAAKSSIRTCGATFRTKRRAQRQAST